LYPVILAKILEGFGVDFVFI